MIGIIAPPNKPCKPLNNVIDRKLSEIAHPKLENIKPDKLIRKKILVDKRLISHPLKGIIMTSVISDAENTYEISSMLAFSSPCKYFNEEPTTSTLSIFKTKPLSRIKYINNFFLFIFLKFIEECELICYKTQPFESITQILVRRKNLCHDNAKSLENAP